MPIRLISLSFAIICCALLDGCAEDPFRPLVDALLHKNEKSTTSTISTDQKSVDTCKKVAFVSALDIDTAYARAMSAFHFRTWAQRKHDVEMNSRGFIDDNFKHDAQPGAFYAMTDRGEWNDTQDL